MYREFIASTGLGGLHLVGMVILFVCFVAVVGYALLGRGARRRGELAARLPFDEGTSVPPGGDGARGAR